jgi:WD40 repeat protein
MVAASAADGKVWVWDTESRIMKYKWQMPGSVHSVAFAPDSRHIATANGDGSAYILHLPSGGAPPP